jgi:hypothetical protein
LDPDQIALGLIEAGFVGWQVATVGAIVMAESGGYVMAHGYELSVLPDNPVFGSVSWGLLGLNDYWAPKVLSAELLAPVTSRGRSLSQFLTDPRNNFHAGREMFLLGAIQRGYARAYTVWSSWSNGKHIEFLHHATDAARSAGAIL